MAWLAIGQRDARGAVLTLVAHSGDNIGGYTPVSFNQRPTINNSNKVAYIGYLGTGGGLDSVIYVNQTKLFAPGDSVGSQSYAYAYGPHPVINNNGSVAFGFRNFSGTTILATSSNGPVFNFDTQQINGKTLGSIGQCVYNDSGTFLFNSNYLNGGTIIITSPSAVLVQQGQTIDGFTISGMNGVDESSMNNSGTIVFRGGGGPTYEFTQTQRLVGTGSIVAGTTLTNVNPDAAINDAGDIAYQGFFGSSNGIFTLTRNVVNRNDTLGGHQLSSIDSSVDINNKDHVAYLADYVGGGQGIFLEHGLLVSTGDVVGGHTIASLFRPSLNDNDTVAAYATFTDGSSGIITAVPEPTLAVVMLLALRLRLRRTD
jgi:hypothetical protein